MHDDGSASWDNRGGAVGLVPTNGTVHAVSKEYETEIHFQKCYGVMAEIFDEHNNLDEYLPEAGYKFLDLGCAPGGFSSFLLEDPRCSAGFGVTLPALSGGFPVRVRSDRFFLQQADLFEVGPNDLLASEVNVCICDAQYLRNNISWEDKYRGVRCRSKQHGVWALLSKQLWLGLSRLQTGGILIFRFGWRDPGPEDPATIWYKRQTLRLFTLLRDLFEEVHEIKSDYFNALQSSFYVCCVNFDRDKFDGRQVDKLLGKAFNYLVTTDIEDSNALEIFPQIDKIRDPKMDEKISDMLDRINKLRLVHEQSRERHKQREAKRDDPRAVLCLAPLPEEMPDQELQKALSVFGRVDRIDRAFGGKEASVQFALQEHAQTAAYALRVGGAADGALGEGTRAWLKSEDSTDQGGQEHRNREWGSSQAKSSSKGWQHNGDSGWSNGRYGDESGWQSGGADGWGGVWDRGGKDTDGAAGAGATGGGSYPNGRDSDHGSSAKGGGQWANSYGGSGYGNGDGQGKGKDKRRKGAQD